MKIPAQYILCSLGHPTLLDPPGCPLVRLPCGCAVATASPEAFEKAGILQAREEIIREVARGQYRA